MLMELVSFLDLYNGVFEGDINELTGGYYMYSILIVGTIMKLVLYIYCSHINKNLKLDTIDALAEDHYNDVCVITLHVVYTRLK